MTRVLTFDGPRAAKRFQLLWTALTGNSDGKDRTPAVIRKEARLQESFDAISRPTPTDLDPEARTLNASNPHAPTITLAQEDFDLLQQHTEKVPWNPRFSRDVVDLWDWLSASDKRD